MYAVKKGGVGIGGVALIAKENTMDEEWKSVAAIAAMFAVMFAALAMTGVADLYWRSVESKAAIEAGLIQKTDEYGNVVWTRTDNQLEE